MKLAAIVSLFLLLIVGFLSSASSSEAAPRLIFPWPRGHEHRISGGATYNCFVHQELTETGGPPLYNADYYAIDFQFGSIDGSPLNVSAVASGTIIYRDNNQDGYGNKIVIDHGNQLYSVYAHLADNSWGVGILPGAHVAQGQPLALAGDTGSNEYEVHLHFHMMKGANAYKPEPMWKQVTGFDQYGFCTDITSNYWLSCDFTDHDCDGFPSTIENFTGTSWLVQCSANSIGNNEPLPDSWPIDFDDNQLASGSDVLHYNFVFGSQAPGPPYAVRYDLNADAVINGADILQFNFYFGKNCIP